MMNSISGSNATWTSVKQDARYYKMDHNKQGHAYIFNHKTFKNKHDLSDRNGTDEDGKRLAKCLRYLNFEVQPFIDLKRDEIKIQVDQAAEMDHSDMNCIFFAVLTHGSEDSLLYAYDFSYDPSEMFWNQFTADKCPTLAGKPKIFLFVNCQGTEYDSGFTLIQKPGGTEYDGGSPHILESYKIPVHADFLLMHSTIPGYYSYRNTTSGSFYMKAFCKVLKKHAYEEHILTILTLVNQKIATEFESETRDPKLNKKKQISCFYCSLTRLLQFVDIAKRKTGNEDKNL